ncbi:MAG: hypothetical protein H0V74_02335 [Chloroflexi bacterium]|nr:hypothetical protein [Chloroflexota bacterium]
MPSSTSPRIPLERAQYFLARAERLTATERREFDNDLQAAVVFGRSVYHYLQSLAAPANADAGYRAWFRSKKTTLAADPVLEYFRRERDLTLKERSKGVQRRVSMTGHAQLHVSGYAEMTVIRGAPWYRRSPSIVWQDTWATITRPLKRWLHRIAEDLKRRRRNLRGRMSAWQARRRAAREVPSVREFYFADADPEGKDRPAVDLVREYLTRLEVVVRESEASFPLVVG